MRDCVAPDSDKIIIDRFNKNDIRYYESVMSQSNGYMGIRGNFEESFRQGSLKGTYIAGVWFPDKTRVGWWKNGYPEYFGKVINAVDFIGIQVFVGDHEIDLSRDEIIDFSYILNMKTAVLMRTAMLGTPLGRVRLQSSRFLSCAQKELCCIEYSVCLLDQNASVTLIPFLNINVCNDDANYNESFWENNGERSFKNGGYVEARTKPNCFKVEQYTVGAAMSVVAGQEPVQSDVDTKTGYVGLKQVFDINRGESARIQKFIAVATSRDHGGSISKSAAELVENAVKKGYSKLQEEHQSIFSLRMANCDVQLEGDLKVQQGLRYNLFQLVSTYSGEDQRLNIGPKGFTGEKYGGAAYWDTEAFLIPFYLGVSEPNVARNLLLYRYNTLEQAKSNARKLGLKGALYPMVTFDGNECHNEWEITFEEIHRNGAIAYAIFNYVTYTGDEQYLIDYGFNVLLEISRFWIDRVHYSKNKDVYFLHGVTGPNEYENNVNNNWYTNRIAKWCLDYTVNVAERFEGALAAEYTGAELEIFKTVSNGMYLPYDSELEIFVQHDTFLDKELIHADTINKEERPLCQHWSWDRILRSCFIKQADVVQGLYLLHDCFDNKTIRRNFEFYEPMTLHESSLSAGVHSVVASRAGLHEIAYELFMRTIRLDLDDVNNDTSDGLHITSMSSSWLGLTQGFAGLITTRGIFELAPYLPEQLTSYAFNIHYRGRILRIEVNSRKVLVTKLSGDDLAIVIYDNRLVVKDSVETGILTAAEVFDKA